MAMPNTKARKERIDAVNSSIDTKLAEIKATYENSGFGFNTVAESGFNKTNVLKDLSDNVKAMAIPEEETMPSLGIVNGYNIVNALPLKGYAKNDVVYANPNNPSEPYTETRSNTLMTDRADGNLDINRWTSRNIFRFTAEQYGYDRCVFIIPLADLANGVVIDGGEDTPHGNTLKSYPYPEEIIMTSQKTEKNFIHFINVQYSDGHYGHFNGRNYNLMIVKDRTRYGELNDSGDGFKEYTSVYANDIETELAYISNGYLYLPVPDEVYGEELLNTLWDCRVIWRSDEPNRNINVSLMLDYEKVSNNHQWYILSTGTTNDIRREDICYGDSKYIMVRYDSNIFDYSTDGITWTEVIVSNTNRSWKSICYGNDKFVAVSTDSISAYSYDGINWTESTISNYSSWHSVCYGNDKFVAVAYNSKLFAYSYDGITWTEGTIGTSINMYLDSICYGNGIFVATGPGYKSFMYSTDGKNWTQVTVSGTIRNWREICYGNDKFVAVADDSIFAYSYDGINWTEGTISETLVNWHSVCYGNDKFVAVAYNSKLFAYSYDGITWTEGTISDIDRSWRSVCYGNDKFVATTWGHQLACLSEYNDLSIIHDRLALSTSVGSASILKNRNSVTNNIILSTNIHSICAPVAFSDSSILISPTFSHKYSTKNIDEHDWLSEGTPNQIYRISDNHYLGFYYCNNSIHVARTAPLNINGYTTQLYWTLFDNTMKTINPTLSTDIQSIYPCNSYSEDFAQTGTILKVFECNINRNTGISSYYIFTNTGAYKFTFSLTNNTLSNTSIETLLTYDIHHAWKVVRISESAFLIFGINFDGLFICNEVNVVNKTSISTLTDEKVDRLFGRTCNASINDGIISAEFYDDIPLDVEDGTTDLHYEEFKNFIGRYGLVVDYNDSYLKLIKLVEKFTFDKELLAPPSYWIIKEYAISDVDQEWTSICYGKDKYIAVGKNGACAYSYDGITWIKTQILQTIIDWAVICYGDDKFIALSDYNNISAYSYDGIIWHEISTPRHNYKSACYGKGMFIAVSHSSKYICYSTDGINWTESATGQLTNNWHSICYGNDMFVAITFDSSLVCYSYDGFNWKSNLLENGNRYSICYGNGIFVISCRGDLIEYSEDGNTWQRIRIGNDYNSESSMCFGGGKFLRISNRTNNYSYSEDGINWTVNTVSNINKVYNSICYGNGKFVALAPGITFANFIEV